MIMLRTSLIVLILSASAASQWTISGGAPPAPPPPPLGDYWHGIIDPTRATDWSTAGVRGGIPTGWPTCGNPIQPTGIVAWRARRVYAVNDKISDSRGYTWEVQTAGTSMSDEPNWSTTPGGTTTDGPVTWVMSSGIDPLAQPRWWGQWGYLVGDMVEDSNGNSETVTTAGTSADPKEPNWTSVTTVGGTLQEGTVTWRLAQLGGTDAAVIKDALAICNKQSQVVQLAAGTFYITKGLMFPDQAKNVVLRGMGADQTTLAFYGNGSATSRTDCGNSYLCATGSTAYVGRYVAATGFSNYYGGAARWTGGYAQGSKMIVTQDWVGNAPTANDVGSPIFLDQRGDDINICAADGSGLGPCAGQVGLSMSGTTVTVHVGIAHGFHVGQCVGIGSGVGSAISVASYTAAQNQTMTCTAEPLLRMGWFTVASVLSPTSFTYELPTQSNLPNSGGGRVIGETGGLINSNVPMVIVNEQGSYGRPCPPSTAGQPMPVAGATGTDCEVGFGGGVTRQQMEGAVIAGVIQGGTGSCPAGSLCIELSDELIWPNWQFAKGPGVWWAGRNPNNNEPQYATKIGVEDLTIDSTNDGMNPGSSGGAGVIKFTHATDSWVKGVRFINTNRNAVWFIFVQHGSMIDNYKASGKGCQSTAYGFETESMTAHSLIANNFCEFGPNCVMSNINEANVVAYNYGVNAPFYTPGMRPMIHQGHAASAYNLFEGNNSPAIAADNVHGAGNANTTFRSRMRGADFPRKANVNDAVDLKAGNRGFNFVGNVIGTAPDDVVGGPLTQTLYYFNPTQNQNNNVFNVGKRQAYYTLDILSFRSGLRWGNYDAVTQTTHWCGDASSPGWTTDCLGMVSATRSGTTPNPSNGQGGQACYVFFNRGATGWSSWGFIRLTGTNTVADGTPIEIVTPGVSYPSTPPTTAFMATWQHPPAGIGAAACPGNFNITSTTAPVSEIPGAFTGWAANPVPVATTLPPSFYTKTQPSFWQMKAPLQTPPWPAIGPDITASGPLDASCVPDYPNILNGPGSPSACDGIAHHSYQIPSQICYNSLQNDPAYPQKVYGPITNANYYTLTGYGTVIEFTVANLFPARLVKNNSVMNMTEAVDVQGVTPSSFNGRYVLAAATRNSITVFRITGNPGNFVSGVGSTVKNIVPKKFNEHGCYANE